MNRWIGMASLLVTSVLFMVWTAEEGCRNTAAPTFPATNTSTPLPSATPTTTPTSTITNTPAAPTNTPTSTATGTPTATCSTTTTPALIDDMEAGGAGGNQLIVQQCRGGYWYAYNDGTRGGLQSTGGIGMPLPPAATATAQFTPTAEPWTKVAPGTGFTCTTGSSTYAVEVSANNGFPSYNGFGFNLTNPTAPYDASAYTGIQFCAKNSTGSLTIQFQVKDANSDNAGAGPHSLNANLTTAWQQFQFTMAQLVASSNAYGGPTVFQPSKIKTFQWVPPNATTYDIFIDNVSLY